MVDYGNLITGNQFEFSILEAGNQFDSSRWVTSN